ncbi:MAG: hypothetical protein AABW67_00930 [Nanoarchaeota archaeon]
MNNVKKSFVFGIFVLIIVLGMNFVFAEKLEIQIKNNYIPREDINFKLILYNDENNKIDGQINYVIYQNDYSKVLEGVSDSGQEIIYKLPENATQGPWKIEGSYNGVKVSSLFNVGELERADIKLEGDALVLKNIGNTVYEKKILIYIGEQDQTAQIILDIGQEKRIRLTAPDGKYDIKVIEGNEEKPLEFKDVSLTGEVIGLERVFSETNSFWQKYPLVILFLGSLLLVIIVVVGFKFKNKHSK